MSCTGSHTIAHELEVRSRSVAILCLVQASRVGIDADLDGEDWYVRVKNVAPRDVRRGVQPTVLVERSGVRVLLPYAPTSIATLANLGHAAVPRRAIEEGDVVVAALVL